MAGAVESTATRASIFAQLPYTKWFKKKKNIVYGAGV